MHQAQEPLLGGLTDAGLSTDDGGALVLRPDLPVKALVSGSILRKLTDRIVKAGLCGMSRSPPGQKKGRSSRSPTTRNEQM